MNDILSKNKEELLIEYLKIASKATEHYKDYLHFELQHVTTECDVDNKFLKASEDSIQKYLSEKSKLTIIEDCLIGKGVDPCLFEEVKF